TIQLRLDGYSYGLSSSNFGTGKFSIRKITEPDPLHVRQEYHTIPGTDKEILVTVANRYYSIPTVSYDDEVAATEETSSVQIFQFEGEERQLTTTITRENLEKQDTLVARARLDDDFGMELFSIALNNDNEELSDLTKFRTKFKGLAFIPEGCNAVYGFDPSSSFSRIRLYYHSQLGGVNVDTLTRDFTFSGVSFHNIIPDRVEELPPADPPYIAGEATGSLRVIQAGYPMVTKIDLSSFYDEFA